MNRGGYESTQLHTKPAMNAKSQKIYEEMLAKQKIQKGGMSHQDYLINRGKMYEQKRMMEQ